MLPVPSGGGVEGLTLHAQFCAGATGPRIYVAGSGKMHNPGNRQRSRPEPEEYHHDHSYGNHGDER
jgi:hypothetical protein